MKWFKAKFPGIRYRFHDTRKHGLKPDKYFSIRYKLDGKDKEEGLGWASNGWNEQKANETLSKIKKNIRTGDGAQSLAEQREKAETKRQKEAEQKTLAEREKITFSDIWPQYLELAKATKKNHTVYQEVVTMGKWVFPVIGKKPLKKICALDIERIKKNHLDAGRRTRTANSASYP